MSINIQITLASYRQPKSPMNGKSAKHMVKKTYVHTRIQNGDKVVLAPSTAGEAAHVQLVKLPEMAQQVHITINGVQIMLPRLAYVNGELKLGSYEIQNGDEIRIQNWYTVEQVAQYADIPLLDRILVNDTPARADTKVYEGFGVKLEQRDWQEEEDEEEITEIDYSVSEPAHRADTVEEEKPEEEESLLVTVNGQSVNLRGKKEYIFVDVFDFIEFDLGDSRGRNIVTLLNGRPAQHMETLHPGDVIDIHWE